MASREEIKKELALLHEEGLELLLAFRKPDKEQTSIFKFDYQKWYSKSLPVVRRLAPDRYEEFRRYYEPDPKRKALGYGTYVIQDYIKGVAPHPSLVRGFNAKEQASHGFMNQIAIFASIEHRIDSILSEIDSVIFTELKDAELATANALLKVSPRAAGALAGVVLEAYLQRVANTRGVAVSKKSPTLADLNDPLKAAGVYDKTTWRKISYLADLRNLCSHNKATDPKPDQVMELIEGVNWVLKNLA
ncbi:MAG: hypothetical protein HY316_05520 [Acidobacteria bacterium]|nr:hypothetical protein [Acidobacteriota bacterium]